MKHVIFSAPQLMSKETMAPFGAELTGDSEQQVSVMTAETPRSENVTLSEQSWQLEIQS